MAFVIRVCFNSSHAQAIEMSSADATVNALKERLARLHDLPADDIRVIFQGQELPNSVTLQSCQLSEHSCLHALRGRTRRTRSRVTSCESNPPTRGLNEIADVAATVASTFQPMTEVSDRVRFYVYCKSVCHSLQPGKLRVICAKCKQGTLMVDRAPRDWSDVLNSNHISGQCHAEGCPGTMAEFVFKCAMHSSAESEACPVLELVKTNSLQIPCVTCISTENPVLVFPCNAGHTMCLDCFRTYAVTKLNSRMFTFRPELGYTLECPAGCDFSWIRTPHHFRLLGEEQYGRFQRIAAEECLLQMGGVICPAPNCGAGLLPGVADRTVVCEQLDGSYGCGMEFCVDCHEVPHEGDCLSSLMNSLSALSDNDYKVQEVNAEKAEWEKQSKMTVLQTTKPCPGCKVPVEKAGGCMHMHCARCDFDWCWLCATRWSRDCEADHWFGE